MEITIDRATWNKFWQYTEVASFAVASVIGGKCVGIDAKTSLAYSTTAFLCGKAVYWVTKAAKAEGLISHEMQRTLGWTGGFVTGTLCGSFLIDPKIPSLFGSSGWRVFSPSTWFGSEGGIGSLAVFSAGQTLLALAIRTTALKTVKQFVKVTPY